MQKVINKPASLEKYIYYSLLIMFFVTLGPVNLLIGIPSIIVRTGFYQILLGLLLVAYYLHRNEAILSIHPLIIVFYMLVLYMSVMGISNPNSISLYYREDFLVYIRIAIFMHLGYKIKAYLSFTKVFLLMVKWGLIINILAVLYQNINIRTSVSELPLSYSMQTLLVPSTFFLFQLKKINKSDRLWIISAFVFYCLEQIIFQKRAPILRVVLITILFFYNNITVYKESYADVFRFLFSSLISLTIALFLLNIIGISISSNYDSLINRFNAEGSILKTSATDVRLEYGDIFIEDLERTNEIWTGRGFSSVVFDDRFLVDETTGLRFRNSTEMGVPTILLKGGIFLLFFYGLFFIRMLFLRKIFLSNPITNAAFLFLFVWFIFIYIEGTMGALSNINEILIAYCLGILLTPSNDIKNNKVCVEY